MYRFLDLYFVEADREAWFVRHDGRLAGFALTRSTPDDVDPARRPGPGAHAVAAGSIREVAEFFVVRAHRRAGVGRRAAAALFARSPGRWEVAYDAGNEEAAGFWPAVVEAAARGPIQSRREGPPERTYRQVVLRFSTR